MLYNFFLDSMFHMVNVNDKAITNRLALSAGEIFVGEKAFFLIKKKLLSKGDVLVLSEISGILGAKKTSDFLVLCHPIFLNCASVLTLLRESDFTIIVYCLTSSDAKTGVEMESLCGVFVSLLTIYDLVKIVVKCLFISNVKLLLKLGGKSFLYIENSFFTRFLFMLFFKYQYLPYLDFSVAIISVGTRVKEYNFTDNSGIRLCSLFKKYGALVNFYTIVNDDKLELKTYLNNLVNNSIGLQLIILVGGTGPGVSDISSCVLDKFCDKKILGISEMLRIFSSQYSRFSWFSNTIVGISRNKVLLSIPGNSNAVVEYFFLLLPVLKHLLKLVEK